MLILCVRLGRYFNSRPHGGRLRWAGRNVWNSLFQLTPSRRATPCPFLIISSSGISTHALTEGDLTSFRCSASSIFQLTPSRRATACTDRCTVHADHFNSRPHGGRPGSQVSSSRSCGFQLTPSRRATHFPDRPPDVVTFQLTPSRRATYAPTLNTAICVDFNSRPHGGRHILSIASAAR